MVQAAVRQAARQAVLEAQTEMKAERTKREKRLSGLGIDVAVALRERDAAIQRWELQSARALQKMLDEGLNVKEALQWCGPEINRGEAIRLIKLREQADASNTDEQASSEEDGQEVPRDGASWPGASEGVDAAKE